MTGSTIAPGGKPDAPSVVKPSTVVAPIDRLAVELHKQTQKFAAVMSGGLDAKRLFRLAVESVQKTPRLMEALQNAPETVVNSLLVAAECGLEVGSSFGHGYLVPVWNGARKRVECGFWKGYKGVVHLLVRSGTCKAVEAHVVYENDEFELVYGVPSTCRFSPQWRGDRGAPLGCLVLYTLSDGTVKPHFLPAEHFERVKAAVNAKNKGKLPDVWVTWWEDAWRKTAIMHGAKFLALGPTVDRKLAEHAMNVDEPDRIETADVVVRDSSPIASTESEEDESLLAAARRAKAERDARDDVSTSESDVAPTAEPDLEPKSDATPKPADANAEPPDDEPAPDAASTPDEQSEKRRLIAEMRATLDGRPKGDPVLKVWSDQMRAFGATKWDDLSLDELRWTDAAIAEAVTASKDEQ